MPDIENRVFSLSPLVCELVNYVNKVLVSLCYRMVLETRNLLVPSHVSSLCLQGRTWLGTSLPCMATAPPVPRPRRGVHDRTDEDVNLVRFAGSESHNITVVIRQILYIPLCFFSSPKGKGKAGFIYQFSVPM